MSLWNSVLVDSDAGVKVLREVMIPIPAYSPGTIIGYWVHSSKEPEPYVVEAGIVSYEISVYPTGMDADGNMEYEYDIKYFLDNDYDVLEEEITYSYPDEEEETTEVSEQEVHGDQA